MISSQELIDRAKHFANEAAKAINENRFRDAMNYLRFASAAAQELERRMRGLLPEED